MAFTSIPTSLTNVGKAVKKELIDLIKANFDDHESRISGLSLGATPIEIFNDTIANASSASTITGLSYYRATTSFSVSIVQVAIFAKGSISSGTISIDIKKSTTGLGGTFTSILTTPPAIDFSTASDYDTATGVLNSSLQSVNQNDILRLDVIGLPSNTLGKFRVLVYGNI
jgi:hypothetical protein